jgi:hypothetical protein
VRALTYPFQGALVNLGERNLDFVIRCCEKRMWQNSRIPRGP